MLLMKEKDLRGKYQYKLPTLASTKEFPPDDQDARVSGTKTQVKRFTAYRKNKQEGSISMKS